MLLDNIIPEEGDPADRYRSRALHDDVELNSVSKLNASDVVPNPKEYTHVSSFDS